MWLEAYAAPPKPYCRSSAWRLGRAAVVVADGIWRRRRRLALPSGRNSDPAALAGGGAPTAARPWLRIHLTPFLLNGYPCLLCPCVVCFKFLQPKVIEGKKIDCALADPHLPRLLGGAPHLFKTNLVWQEKCERIRRRFVKTLKAGLPISFVLTDDAGISEAIGIKRD